MPVFNRLSILEAGKKPFRTEKVSVEEWGNYGDYVLVRNLTARERDEFEQFCAMRSNIQKKGKNLNVDIVGIKAKLAVLSCVDDEGKKVFTNDDIDGIQNLDCVPLNRIYETAQRLSGFSSEAVEELEGNLQDGQKGCSG